MTDIVERLRKRMVRRELGDDPLVKVFGEAADEIERLLAKVNELDGMWRAADKGGQAEIDRLRAALQEIVDRQHEAIFIVNNQGAAFPGSLALACEKARALLKDKP